MARIATFDDWVEMFRAWRRDIGVDEVNPDYRFTALFGDLESPEIQFGAYAGEPKWEKLSDIPDQRIKDALLNYIVYQGDTEFASVEQQRHLFATAPSDWDRAALARIMTEEMRHGWQMSHLLVTYFGSSGRLEAEKLLSRRADQHQRLLGAFNIDVNNWLDLYTYQEFQDRDGKFQLEMLSRSAFAPLARSMGPMLREESFHLGTGHTCLKRVLQANRIPTPIIQRHFNKWVPACYDLFGTDNSSSAQWAYVWGLKGRFKEDPREPADRETLNETARAAYLAECRRLVDDLNRLIPDDQPKLRLPDVRFNRRIGRYADQPYDVDGNLLPVEEFSAYLASQLPTPQDMQVLSAIFADNDWIVPRDARLPEPKDPYRIQL
jgi:benzoyl-CoA 2,3-dioxygenase component B